VAVRTFVCRDGRVEELHIDPSTVSDLLAEPSTVVWLDVEDPTQQDMAMLGEEFGFHPLTLEDSIHPHQRPKIEQYETYFFMIAYGLEAAANELIQHELAIFVGKNYLVTVRKPPALDLAGTTDRVTAHTELLGQGGGYLLYVLLDEIVDGYFDILDAYEDRVEEVEDLVYAGRVEAMVQNRIFTLKRDLIQFRRRKAPLREVLDVMQRRIVPVVTEPLEPYYRDVYDHVLRATDFADTLRDLLSSALEASLAVISNRLNEVMKNLTSWGAIILVPTLIAGIYGMNFRHMPELGWLMGYPFALGLMAVSAGLLYRVFRRRGWL
jgi:magnesium transporter